MRVATWLVVTMLMLASVPAWAQEEERPVNFNFGGGYTATLGEAGKSIGNGYNFGAGLRVNLLPKIGVQVEYMVHSLAQQTVSIPVALVAFGTTTNKDFSSDARLRVVSVNAVLKPAGGGRTKSAPYLLVGGGIYWRPVEVSTPAVGHVKDYCNPAWYLCFPTGWVAVDSVVGERTTRDYGVDVGAGIDFKIREGKAAVYIEARYHYVFGPQILDGDGTSHGRATGHYLPINMGLRF
jgi:hypothetical protein